MTNKAKSITCDSCGKGTSSFQVHTSNCLHEILGSCDCPNNESHIQLTTLLFHGRTLELCEECHAKERVLLKDQTRTQDVYTITRTVENRVIAEIKKLHQDFERWQEIYVTERPNWILANFESPEEMRNQLVDFIVGMEKLEWEIKSKRRAAFDAAKELDARLTKEERDKLISDPSFKPASNSEFKKISQDRELDEAIKTIGLDSPTKEQRKQVAQLLKIGMTPKDIKATLKL